MKAIAFAGPSVFGVDRHAFDGIEFRPPAACGDILTAVTDGATCIGLIDGYFGHQVAVLHKEILFALSRGVRMAGAASMGALRAAECAGFGMVGLGAVYADYASGARTSDGDVAISHAPEEMNFMPTSVALVDLEATLAAMQADLLSDHYMRLIAAGRRVHFSNRTWQGVVREAEVPAEVLQHILRCERSVKREDALKLLEWLQRQRSAPQEVEPVWQFQDTAFFDRLRTSAAFGASR